MNIDIDPLRSPQGGHSRTRPAVRFADVGAAVGCENAFCTWLRRQSTGLGMYGT